MTRGKLRNRTLSVLLVLAMVIAMMPVICGEAYAESSVETFDFSNYEVWQKLGATNPDEWYSSLGNDDGIINIFIQGYCEGWDEKEPGIFFDNHLGLYTNNEDSELKLTADKGYRIKTIKIILYYDGWYYYGFNTIYDPDYDETESNNYNVSPDNAIYSFKYSDDEVYEIYACQEGTSEFKLSCDSAYMGASIKAIEVTYDKVDTDEWDNSAADLVVHGKATKKTITYNWNEVSGASRYKVYFNRAGSKYTCKKITTTGKTSFKKVGLKKGTKYKAYVAAYNRKGKIIVKSKTIYVTTKK